MTDGQRESWDRLYKKKGELWSRKHDDWFLVRDDESVLDLGCSTGKSIDGLKGRITGVDFSVTALKSARQGYPSADFVASDMSRLPFKNDSFDLVRASYIFGHSDEIGIRTAIDEISRVLSTSGRLAIEVFTTRDGRCGRGNLVTRNTYRDGDGIVQRYFEPPEIEDLFYRFEKQQLEIVEWDQRIGPKLDMRRSAIRAIFRKR